tara:strand:- start:48 stop:668 length:621 start_codon:yes stop_codon:yes gene_type:complete
MSLDVITVGDKNTDDIRLVWFHGYGANNWGFEPFIKILNLNMDGRLHVVMPNAPLVNGKRSWYPLPTELDGKIVEDDKGIENSKIDIIETIHDHIKDSKRLYLGGFSQGAALSLSIGLNDDIECDGIIAISGYIPSASTINIKNKEKELFIAHGTSDTTISIETHKKSIQFLDENGVGYHEFIDDCGHTISKSMISNLSEWLYKKL